MNLKHQKKGQMQMGETIMVIIIVLFLIAMGFIFYGKFKETSINEKQNLFQELDVVKLSQITYSLPEIQCSFAEVPDYGCIDILRYEYLARIINDSYHGMDKDAYFYYRELFGTGKISLQIINNTGNVDIMNLYLSNISWTSKEVVYLPTTVYNPIEDKKSFGVLVVEKYG